MAGGRNTAPRRVTRPASPAPARGDHAWLLPFGVLLAGGLVVALVLSRGAETPPLPTFSPTPSPVPDASPSDGPTPSASPTEVDERKARFKDVHGLAERDGALLLATQEGLWRIGRKGGPVKLGGPAYRWSTLAADRDGTLLASGLDEDGAPLGLVRSADGERWRPVALSGETAFRRLVLAHGRAWAWSPDGRMLRSIDLRTWEQIGEPQPRLHDLAVHPGDPTRLLRSVPEGGAGLPEIQESRDGGQNWKRIAAPSIALLEWRQARRLWGLTEDGTVFLSEDAGYSWRPRTILPAPPTALLDTGQTLYAALREVGVYRSTDDGKTWKRLDLG